MMKSIREYLNKHRQEMLDFTEKIINVDSAPDDTTGVQKVADILSAKMRKLGMKTRQIDTGKPGMVLVGQLATSNQDPPVIFLGHMDTVFPKGTAARRPFSINEDKMTGPGIYDMKPGLTIALFALQALVDLKLIKRPVKMIIVSDEEKLHINSNAYSIIARECQGGAYGLNFEGSPGRQYVSTTQRGGAIVDITVYGHAAHSGADPKQGRSAIVELAHQIIKLNALTDLAQGIHINCGTVSGGSSENIIPGLARTGLGIRFKTNAQRDRLLKQIRQIANHPTVGGTHTSVTIRTKVDSMEETAGVKKLLNQLQKVARECGYGTITGRNGGGASDAGIMVSRGVPTLDGMGVVGGGAHVIQEHSSVQSLLDRAILVANFVARK